MLASTLWAGNVLHLVPAPADGAAVFVARAACGQTNRFIDPDQAYEPSFYRRFPICRRCEPWLACSRGSSRPATRRS